MIIVNSHQFSNYKVYKIQFHQICFDLEPGLVLLMRKTTNCSSRNLSIATISNVLIPPIIPRDYKVDCFPNFAPITHTLWHIPLIYIYMKAFQLLLLSHSRWKDCCLTHSYHPSKFKDSLQLLCIIHLSSSSRSKNENIFSFSFKHM